MLLHFGELGALGYYSNGDTLYLFHYSFTEHQAHGQSQLAHKKAHKISSCQLYFFYNSILLE